MDDIIYEKTMTYTNNALCGLSFILNTIVFIVFNRKGLRDLSMSRYLSAIAVLDPLFVTFGSIMNHSDIQNTSWSCKIISYFFVGLNRICTWISCIVSVDRLLSVAFLGKVRKRTSFHFKLL